MAVKGGIIRATVLNFACLHTLMTLLINSFRRRRKDINISFLHLHRYFRLWHIPRALHGPSFSNRISNYRDYRQVVQLHWPLLGTDCRKSGRRGKRGRTLIVLQPPIYPIFILKLEKRKVDRWFCGNRIVPAEADTKVGGRSKDIWVKKHVGHRKYEKQEEEGEEIQNEERRL